MRIGAPTFLWATIFSEDQLQKRHRDGPPPSGQSDFLEKLLETKTKYPELVDDNTVVMYLLGNVLAGSDTTASTMSSAVYHVLKNPAVHEKLREELRAADLSLPARWKDLKDLKYLNAVMRESMRIHPGVGLMIERVVPKGGFTLPDGRFVPEGTIVGMNPWVINKDEEVFGAYPESFIPERWLPSPGESDENYQARFSKMKGTDFTFGAGTRACLGKYLSQLESYKVIATLFSNFDVSFIALDSWILADACQMELSARIVSGGWSIHGLCGRGGFLFISGNGRISLLISRWVHKGLVTPDYSDTSEMLHELIYCIGIKCSDCLLILRRYPHSYVYWFSSSRESTYWSTY